MPFKKSKTQILSWKQTMRFSTVAHFLYLSFVSLCKLFQQKKDHRSIHINMNLLNELPVIDTYQKNVCSFMFFHDKIRYVLFNTHCVRRSNSRAYRDLSKFDCLPPVRLCWGLSNATLYDILCPRLSFLIIVKTCFVLSIYQYLVLSYWWKL